jgi:predicted DsbA family dithiol-disulfide isomerase
MYKQTTILLSLTNITGLLYYNNECSANKDYKEKLNIKNEIINKLQIQYITSQEQLNLKNKIIDKLQTQYITSQENLEKLVIKIKNNDVADIDKYIDYKCPKCYNIWTDVDN